MRKYYLLNIFSTFIIVGSVLAWFFLLPKFIASERRDDLITAIKVKGAQTFEEKKEKTERKINVSTKKEPETHLASRELLMPVSGAPRLKDGYGQTYVRARSAIAIDAEAGTILHFQDGNMRTPIASLTKVMSAIIVVESIPNLDSEIVTIDEETHFTDGTKVGCPRSGYCVANRLRIGEKISAKALFEAMVINSANDAAVALAKHIAGSQTEFARLMNEKAESLKLYNSHFCNPTGLDDDDNPGACYSTAHDIAKITAYSMKHEIIWETMRIKEKEVASADGKIIHKLMNTDLLLDQMENCLGGKTGFTYGAGKSLMTAAHHPIKKERKVVAVMIDNYYRWYDMPRLFDWVFSAYTWP